MQHDPIVLARLVAQAATATASAAAATGALQSYLETGVVEPEGDLISIKDAVIRYDIVIETARRWAKREALGEFIGNRWYLSRALVWKYKGR